MRCTSGFYRIAALVYASVLKTTGIFVLCIISFSAIASGCPCPETCSPCQGNLTKLKLIYIGDDTEYIEAWDRTTRLTRGVFAEGDTIDLQGSLPNSLFRGNVITMIVDGDIERSIETKCGDFEVYKRVGSFIMIAAESIGGGPVCCPPVLLHDNVGPEFLSEPEDLVVDVRDGCNRKVDWSNPDATDCSAFTVTSDPRPGSVLPVGETTVIVTATDARNNTTTTSFKIRVRDVGKPVISDCPKDIKVTTSDSRGIAVNWKVPRASDNCEGVNIQSDDKPNDVFRPGTHTVTYKARDASGNESTCSFKIRVDYKPPDGEPPPGEEPFPVGELFVSKIITPDGDGINDYLQISNIEHFPTNRIVIFDRWGNTLYNAENYDNTNTVWRGEGPGAAKLPTGTYFYSLVVQSRNRKEELRGFIELIN